MMFPAFAAKFKHNISTVTQAFLNKLRRELPDAVDGAGGDYAPATLIEILGAGLSAFFGDITATETLNWGTAAQEPWRILRVTTDADITVRDAGVAYDMINVDGDSLTAHRTMTLAVASDPGLLDNEVIYIVHEASTYNVVLHSEGGSANPIFTLGTQPNSDPEWCAVHFDETAGEFVVIAHGQM